MLCQEVPTQLLLLLFNSTQQEIMDAGVKHLLHSI